MRGNLEVECSVKTWRPNLLVAKDYGFSSAFEVNDPKTFGQKRLHIVSSSSNSALNLGTERP